MLLPIIEKFPNLKIVMEHITTSEAVEFVKSCSKNIAATITLIIYCIQEMIYWLVVLNHIYIVYLYSKVFKIKKH